MQERKPIPHRAQTGESAKRSALMQAVDLLRKLGQPLTFDIFASDYLHPYDLCYVNLFGAEEAFGSDASAKERSSIVGALSGLGAQVGLGLFEFGSHDFTWCSRPARYGQPATVRQAYTDLKRSDGREDSIRTRAWEDLLGRLEML